MQLIQDFLHINIIEWEECRRECLLPKDRHWNFLEIFLEWQRELKIWWI
ncbi:unnamed protein product [Paramecium octaurelia]|uniref:Uncharacterized protein n=1 Tax=Paramecium octaurelia TaxID=43137 RepID=A0A8S1RZ09_PAROT|nr:unnamed protein product [Paramecium octaurelia]